MSMAGEIKSIIFSEFHPTAGPKITCQIPQEYLSKEEFDTLHVYIITKPQIQNRIITVNALGHKILGCPVFIDNPKYARNKLIFNLCLLFDTKTNATKFESAVKKLAGYLTTLELESGYLSNEKTKEDLPNVLSEILKELNSLGTCYIPINESTTIHLQVLGNSDDTASVQEHDVPVFVKKHNEYSMKHLDIATQQLFPYLDGYCHVARIAAEADLDVNIVKACIQNLVHYGSVKLISIFQYSNVYAATPNIGRLASDRELQDECLRYVAKTEKEPVFRNVFLLYCGLNAGTTVKDLCTRHNPHTNGIDERKLIQFGLMKGLIRRLHKFPVKLPNEHGSSKLKHLYRWFNGCHSYDEICCKTGLTYQELDDKVESDPSIVVCWK